MVKIWLGGPKMYYGASQLIRDRAKDLRKSQTESEQELWKHISNKKLGARFRRQHPIHTYIADFFCPELELVIEVDGGIHLNAENKEYDSDRDEVLAEFGITTIRFTNYEINSNLDFVLESISSYIDSLKTQSHD